MNPDSVTAYIVSTLNTAKETIGITGAEEISEDDSRAMSPPYCGIFIDTDEEAGEFLSGGDVINIPLSLHILCASSEHQTVQEAFTQAWGIANKVVVALTGSHTIDGANVTLKLKRTPVTILKKSASETALLVNLFFFIPFFE